MPDKREKLIELLEEAEEWANHKCDEIKCCECPADKMHSNCVQQLMVEHIIANGVTVQEWIPVTERLPENDVMVIGYTPCDGFMFIGYYHEEKKYDWKQWKIVTAMRSTKVMTKKVTHWMPLPEPPKGD